MPIGGEPCWSIKLKRNNFQEFSEDSYIGLAEFRHLFRMPNLEQVPNFALFKRNEACKNPTETQRKQMAQFTLDALIGDYMAVYLSEIKRTIIGDQLSYEFVSELIPSLRYGKPMDRHMLRFQEVFSDDNDVANNDQWSEARIIHGFHHFNENQPHRKNVVSDNLRSTFDLATRFGKPIVHLQASHMPHTKASGLKNVNPTEFQGMLANLVAYEGIPIMYLRNLAPQFGLFNGAIGRFKGLLYLTEAIEIKSKPSNLKFQYKNLTLIENYDLKSAHSVSDLHQLPKGSVVLSIDNEKINSDFDIQRAQASDTVKIFRFKLPTFPPHLPDFVVIEIDEYSKRGGPNILGFQVPKN